MDPTLALPGLYRRAWTLPLTFSRRGPKALYFANQMLFRTTDGGVHWTAISPDLTREHPGSPASLQAAERKLRMMRLEPKELIARFLPSWFCGLVLRALPRNLMRRLTLGPQIAKHDNPA